MTKRNMIIRNIRIMACLVCAMVVAFAYSSEQAFAAVPKVTGVKAKVVANRTVQVSWGKKAGVDGYTVYVATKKRGKYKARTNVGSESTSGKVSGLKVGKTYWFKVRSYSLSSGKKVYSKYSKRVKCVVKVAPPKVKATSVYESTKKIKISYTKSTGARGYEIWRATSKGGKYKKIKTLAGTTFTDSNLTANKAYYYKVRAFSKKKSKKIYGGYSTVVEEISGGNSHQFDLEGVPYKGNSSLEGRKVLFLGSSVTRGHSSGNVSFVDYLRKQFRIDATKEAEDGTTISFVDGDRSYGARLEKYKRGSGIELVVCQLSSNDARSVIRKKGVEVFGDEGDTFALNVNAKPASGDKDEILSELRNNAATADEEGKYNVEDGLKYITAYANLELECPVVFYTMPYFNGTDGRSPVFYEEMMACLNDVCGDWAAKEDFHTDIIDLWNHSSFNSFRTFDESRRYYMADNVHPTKAGYYKMFLPVFERYLKEYFN